MEAKQVHYGTPATPAVEQSNPALKQLNIEVPADLYDLLTKECARRGESKRAAVIRLIEVYTVARESDRAWHITGEECPLSRLIEGIAAEVKARHHM